LIEQFGEAVVAQMGVHVRSFVLTDDHARASFTSGTIRERERQVFFKGLYVIPHKIESKKAVRKKEELRRYS